MLRRWWTNKYKLPWTHKSFLESTELELLIEMYEDIYERNPDARWEAMRGDDGEIYFDEFLGDPLLQKWEKEMAMGVEPDLEEGMGPKAKAQLVKERRLYRGAQDTLKTLSEAEDRLQQSLNQNPKYKSVYATPGSKKEQELLGGKYHKKFDRTLLLGNK